MKFTADRRALRAALVAARRGIDTANPHTTRLLADEASVTVLVVSDGVAISVIASADVGEPGEAVIDGDALSRFVRSAMNGDTVTVEDDQVAGVAGSAVIANGDTWEVQPSAHTRVAVLSSRDLRAAARRSLGTAALARTAPAVIRGASFDIGGGRVTLASTDTYRLGVHTVAATVFGDVTRFPLPERALRALANLPRAALATISVDGRTATIATSTMSVSTTWSIDLYPSIAKVTGAFDGPGRTEIVDVDTSALVDAVQRHADVVLDIRLEAGGAMFVDSTPIDGVTPRQSTSVALDRDRLSSLLTMISSPSVEVTIFLVAPGQSRTERPVRLSVPGSTIYLQPLRRVR